ncbi:restriction endonuclease subunit S [Megasphaera elsdenii]|uniref:Restriction endonuclease subunit S n=1 Tax=Megasphaera elsdenii TaxID=907 RepID=A0A2S0M549_MEGEL|nr:restriction endonuclease subunit S [Megasphaera elsdenii]AVO26570.1 restriction endonuclease subunit S [Megasphaera elsdenii]
MTKHLDIDTQAMRAKILDLAIQGKLTDQREEDGNARDLLKEIQAEKEKLIKEKKIKKGKPLPEITEEEKPFEIPENWEWVRLGDIAQAVNGDRGKNYPKREEYVASGIAWINAGHITDDGYLNADKMNYITPNKYDSLRSGKIQRNDLLFCLRGSFGKVARIEPFCEGAIASSLAIIRLFNTALREYLFIYLKSPQAANELNKYANGTAQPNLAAKDVLKYLIPLPPLAEQHRIADKVSKLFAQLDAIDKAYEEYRELQQTMKAKLLDLAVQGKLTDQREEDGNARDLLKEIQAEKEKLIKEKQIKKEKPLPEITEEEKTFDIPENWMWVRLGEMILNHIGGGTPDKSNEAYWNGDIPWMSVKDVHQDSMYADRTIDSITPAGLENSSSNLIEANRLIVVMRMAVGRAVINKLPVAINQDLRALFFRDNVTQEYILRIFKILKFETSGMTVKGIKLWVLLNTPIPLPPLAEQKRIVAKLDELLPLCNVPGVYSKEK